MQSIRSLLLQGVNGVRKRLGDEDVESNIQLKCIHTEVQELRKDVARLESHQGEKLDRIETTIQTNHRIMNQLLKRVDKALQPRWRGIVFLTGACVITTIVIMLMVF